MNKIDYAAHKVASIIEAIASVEALDFPYRDARDAVHYIRNVFVLYQSGFQKRTSADTALMLCELVQDNIDDFLIALGFIVRACDLTGALELQGPLLRLTRRAIGSHARLILSSQWSLSPFTLLYPGDFGHEFVLVGLPVPEAGNPLIAPLAGHELGHNIWRQRELGPLVDAVKERIDSNVNDLVKTRYWEHFSTVFRLTKEQLDQIDVLEYLSPTQIAKGWGRSQCEEMFCDFVGLSIFGEGYLHAFHYLISPGSGSRNPAYPAMRDRAQALMQASQRLGIAVPTGFREDLEAAAVNTNPIHKLLLDISDEASSVLFADLITAANEHCEAKGLITRNEADVTRIYESFKRAVPATGAESIANIVNAAWRITLDPSNHWKKDYPITIKEPTKRIELIRDLALKSFEVFEIENVQQEQ